MERNETQTRSVNHGDRLTCQKSGQYLQAFRKKVQKTDSDEWTDSQTERKLKVPFGFAGRGLITNVLIFIINKVFNHVFSSSLKQKFYSECVKQNNKKFQNDYFRKYQ